MSNFLAQHTVDLEISRFVLASFEFSARGSLQRLSYPNLYVIQMAPLYNYIFLTCFKPLQDAAAIEYLTPERFADHF